MIRAGGKRLNQDTETGCQLAVGDAITGNMEESMPGNQL
jgi:hypothetical protein